MALVLADRVKETTTTTGTSDFALGGAVSGFQTFSAGVGNNNTTYYAVSLGSDWEVGLGTLSSDGLTLARTTVLQSSNSDTKVSFASGAKDIFVTYAADKAVFEDASGNVTLPANLTVTGGSTTDSVQLDLSAGITPAVGQMAWDSAQGTASLGLLGGNVISRMGQSLVAYVTNAESTTITKGQAVYLFSAQGDRATVKLAYNTGDATSAKTLGIVAEDITANGTGFVVCQGVVYGLNLGSYTAGDTVYLGSTAGSLTATKPYAPNHLVYIGVVEKANAGAGQLYVRVQNGYELDEIHNVSAQSPTTGQTIVWNGATSLWEKNTVSLTAGVNGTLPVANGGTGITSLGTGVATFLGTPSSANLASAVTDETGTGALVFANSPTLVTPTLGTPASATLTNATGLPLSTGVTGTLPVANGGTGQTSYTNGQLLIGNSTGNTLTKATLTAGANVTITNGNGSITIATAGGASTETTTTGSANIVLTSASTPIQNVTMNAVGKYVQLPDATTLSIGSPKYIITNRGTTNPVGVRNSVGTLLGAIDPGESVTCILSSISTSAGVWSLDGNYREMFVTIDAPVSTNDAPYYPYGGYLSANLDDNKSIHCIAASKVVAVDNSTNAIGTPVSIAGTTRGVFRLSATTAIVFYDNNVVSSSHIYSAVVVTISGATTLTLGTPTNSAATEVMPFYYETGWNAPRITQMSATSFIAVGSGASGTTGAYPTAVGITVSGTAVTFGTQLTLTNAVLPGYCNTAYTAGCCAVWNLTSTTALCVYPVTLSPTAQNNSHTATVLTLSGSTVSQGTPATVPAGLGQWGGYTGFPAITPFSSTLFAYCCNGATGNNQQTRIFPINISGTTVSFGSYYAVGGGGYSSPIFNSSYIQSTRSTQIAIPMTATSGCFVTAGEYYNYTNTLYTFYLSGGNFVGYTNYGSNFGPYINYFGRSYASRSYAWTSWMADTGVYKDSKNLDSYGTHKKVNALFVNFQPIAGWGQGGTTQYVDTLGSRAFSAVVFGGTSTTPTVTQGKSFQLPVGDSLWDGNKERGQTIVLNNGDRILLPGLFSGNLYLLRGTDLQLTDSVAIKRFSNNDNNVNPLQWNCLIPVGPQRIVYFMYDQANTYRCISVETTVGG